MTNKGFCNIFHLHLGKAWHCMAAWQWAMYIKSLWLHGSTNSPMWPSCDPTKQSQLPCLYVLGRVPFVHVILFVLIKFVGHNFLWNVVPLFTAFLNALAHGETAPKPQNTAHLRNMRTWCETRRRRNDCHDEQLTNGSPVISHWMDRISSSYGVLWKAATPHIT